MAIGQAKPVEQAKLKALMRLKPTLKDTAAFFECSPSHIERLIRDQFDLSFGDFRDQNMVHTRFELIRNAMKMANNGNTAMMIFCLKNICKWQDKWDVEPIKSESNTPKLILDFSGTVKNDSKNND